MRKQWLHLLPVILLVTLNACSPEQRPPGADRFGDDRTVYQAPFEDVVRATADALFNLGLGVEGGESMGDKTMLISAHKSHSSGVGANEVQVASLQVFIRELTPQMTEVRVRMDNEHDGGLVSSGVAGYPTRADYRARLFTELSDQYTVAEVEQVTHLEQ